MYIHDSVKNVHKKDCLRSVQAHYIIVNHHCHLRQNHSTLRHFTTVKDSVACLLVSFHITSCCIFLDKEESSGPGAICCICSKRVIISPARLLASRAALRVKPKIRRIPLEIPLSSMMINSSA